MNMYLRKILYSILVVTYIFACCLSLIGNSASTYANNANSYSLNSLESRAEAGDAEAQDNLGECYFFGKNGYQKDLSKSVYWYTKSAEQGNPDAQYVLGYCYEKGIGVEKDLSKAVYWYTKSAEKGNEEAILNLAYANEYGWPEVDIDKAKKYYYSLRDSSNSVIQQELREAEQRLETMEFLKKLIELVSKKDMSYDDTKNFIYRIDTSKISYELRSEYNLFSKLLLDVAKATDSPFLDALWGIGKSVLHGFMRDPIGVITTSGEMFYNSYKLYDNSNELTKSWNRIIDIINKENISAAWFNDQWIFWH